MMPDFLISEPDHNLRMKFNDSIDIVRKFSHLFVLLTGNGYNSYNGDNILYHVCVSHVSSSGQLCFEFFGGRSLCRD